MSVVDIEVVSKEQKSFIRSCNVKVGGRTVITPTRAIGVTKSNRGELDIASPLINNKFVPFGEVYARVTLDDLSKIIDDDYAGQKFSLSLATRLNQLRESGAVPYLMLSLVDNERNPYNQMPPPRILDLLFNLIWGTQNNNIVVPPILGVLPNKKQFVDFLNAIEERQKASIDRKDLPIMAVVPSSYRLIAPEILERYWKIGCRVFAFNFENKKYGAFGYVIEKLHSELNEFSKRDKENYIIHALNPKFKTGRGDTSRINNLLGSGFGFDSYGPNHGTPLRWIPPPKPPLEANSIFDSKTYGFFSLSDIITSKDIVQEEILNTNAFKNVDFDSIAYQSSAKVRKIRSSYNLEKTLIELRNFPELIDNEELIKHLSEKNRIQNEIKLMKNVAEKSFNAEKQKKLKEWFK
ncbi:MAG: hypothetical protein LAKADJCE_00374 [Candidatus Argoarchaeum ethanivorans]|uniref:Uncharacterized protein n=1 Tax=Candidatus Argoarchaeum ethanivorans TaxID=2608793 RepID=A0A811TAZ8_9EURY|nr:MAG: hypothetical protein LAKADJCE_00374 [Candidatus Argoarchaeum ethanivorans]